MFRISGYGVFFSPHFRRRSPLRVLSEYEIELYHSVSENAAGYVNEERFVYPKDHVCVFRPGQQRQSSGKFSCYYLKFSCERPEVKELLEQLPTVLSHVNSQIVYQLFQEIFSILSEKAPGYKLMAYGKVCEMVAHLYASTKAVPPPTDKYAAYVGEVYEAVRFMKEHLSEHITLEDVAGRVHLSPSFFHVVFKEIMHKTPHRYLLEMRLAESKNLLINSDLALAVIAEKCGFDSQVYFNYIIKKELGVTPKKYRDAHRNKYYTI